MMKTLLAALLLVVGTQQASVTSPEIAGSSPPEIKKYFELLDLYPQTLGPDGHASLGEIEIIRDRAKIEEIQRETGRKVGIISQDKYWLWLNDAVKFPNGKYGVYGRVLWLQSLKGIAGIAAMALLPNGKIVLNRNYRHATRSWEYELPRGNVIVGEKAEDAAIREVKEETGMKIDHLHHLGTMNPDSGLTNSQIPIFLARVVKEGKASPDESEAIAAIEAFSVKEIKEGFVNGYLVATIEGKQVNVPLRDPFLAYALLQADLRKLLP